MPLADFWSRVSARFVDLLIVNLAWIVAFSINDALGLVVGLAAAAWEIAWLVSRGATPGKLLMGTRVVASDGQPMDLGRSVLRSLDHVALALLGVVSAGASAYGRLYFVTSIVLMALDDENRRSIMDRIAGTTVRSAP